jgi:hypothetical protein
MTPAELLIALHNLADPELVRSVVQATNLCFKEKSIYTHEVLVTVLSKLLEQPNIPILFMRTVLQSLSIYPAMIRFVINILVRLINKQVSVGFYFGIPYFSHIVSALEKFPQQKFTFLGNKLKLAATI